MSSGTVMSMGMQNKEEFGIFLFNSKAANPMLSVRKLAP
jgi:hypothetical protein